MSHTTSTTIPFTTEEGSGSGSGDDEPVYKWRSIVINQVIYLSIVAVVGTIANLLVIYRGLRYKNGLTRSRHGSAMDTTHMLIISLAISNLGTSTFSVGIYIFPLYVPNTPINDFTCRFIWPVRELFTAVACYAFTFIAVGRFLILIPSLRNCKVFSSPIANNVALWVVAYLVFALPFAAAYTPYELNGIWVCDTYWKTPDAERAYNTFLILFNVLVPTFLVCVSYVGIIGRLKRARNVVAPVAGGRISESGEILSVVVNSHRVVKISLLLLLSFIITFVPYAVLLLMIEYKGLDADTFAELETVHAVAFCMLHSGAVMDPLILMLSSNTYRPDMGFLKRGFSS